MNIFIFCGPAAFGKGGMEKVSIALANYWAGKGHSIHFGYFSRKGQTVPSYYVDPQIDLIPYNKKEQGAQAYRQKIVDSQPDVFFLFGASCQVIQIVSLLYNLEIPLVIHEGSNPRRIVGENWANIRKISRQEALWERETVYSQASAIRVTMSEYVKSFSPELRSRVVAFPNAFEINSDGQEQGHRPRIINIGGLKPNKNFLPALKAFSVLASQFPDWELAVFSSQNQTGDGAEYINRITNYIAEKGLQESVKIYVETDDIDREYRRSDIHIITSLSEGFSSSVAEAMCHSLPSIGVKGTPGVDGLIVHQRNGLLVDGDNIVPSLTNVMRSLMGDSAKRQILGEQAERDAKLFQPETVYAEWDRLLERAVKQNIRRSNPSETQMHHCRMFRMMVMAVLSDDLDKIVPHAGDKPNAIQALHNYDQYIEKKLELVAKDKVNYVFR